MKTKSALATLIALLASGCTAPRLTAQPPADSFEIQQRNAAGTAWVDRQIVPQPASVLSFDAARAPGTVLLSTLAQSGELLALTGSVSALQLQTVALSGSLTALDGSVLRLSGSLAAIPGLVDARIATALSTAFVREFNGETGTGVAVIADGSAPAAAGSEGDYYFTLAYESQPAGQLPDGWLIIAWEYSGGSWDFSSQLLPVAAKDLHWVAIRNGGEVNGYYIMDAGGDINHPPQWELLGPDISDFYKKSEVDGAIAAVDAKADQAQGTANDALGDAATAHNAADLATDTANTAQQALAGKQDAFAIGAGLALAGGTLSATATDPLWTQSGNNIYYNSGNVGIGTTNPLYQLQVNATNAKLALSNGSYYSGLAMNVGNQVMDMGVNFNQLGSYNSGAVGVWYRTDVRAAYHPSQMFGVWHQSNASAQALKFRVGSTGHAVLGGYLGLNKGADVVGAAAPAYALDVTGDINLTGDIRKNGVVWNPGGGGSAGLPLAGDAVTIDNPYPGILQMTGSEYGDAWHGYFHTYNINFKTADNGYFGIGGDFGHLVHPNGVYIGSGAAWSNNVMLVTTTGTRMILNETGTLAYLSDIPATGTTTGTGTAGFPLAGDGVTIVNPGAGAMSMTGSLYGEAWRGHFDLYNISFKTADGGAFGVGGDFTRMVHPNGVMLGTGADMGDGSGFLFQTDPTSGRVHVGSPGDPGGYGTLAYLGDLAGGGSAGGGFPIAGNGIELRNDSWNRLDVTVHDGYGYFWLDGENGTAGLYEPSGAQETGIKFENSYVTGGPSRATLSGPFISIEPTKFWRVHSMIEDMSWISADENSLTIKDLFDNASIFFGDGGGTSLRLYSGNGLSIEQNEGADLPLALKGNSVSISGNSPPRVTKPDGTSPQRLKIADPAENDDAATKAYVDGKAGSGGGTAFPVVTPPVHLWVETVTHDDYDGDSRPAFDLEGGKWTIFHTPYDDIGTQDTGWIVRVPGAAQTCIVSNRITQSPYNTDIHVVAADGTGFDTGLCTIKIGETYLLATGLPADGEPIWQVVNLTPQTNTGGGASPWVVSSQADWASYPGRFVMTTADRIQIMEIPAGVVTVMNCGTGDIEITGYNGSGDTVQLPVGVALTIAWLDDGLGLWRCGP
jgi:hypothetical protein